MRTLNYVVLVLVLASFGFVSFGCGDDSSPTAPSVMQEAPPSVRATAPSTPVMGATPASFDADLRTVAPGDARYGPNAYDFYAHMDSGMLHVALVEDAMQTMRNASQPHRMRQVDVYHVTSEPRHVLQTQGDPIYSGSVRLSGRLELPPLSIPSCAPHEWIVVQAAELSDDRYDGWRNAPCPQPDGVVVGSDGSGPGWERSERGAPERDFPPEPEPMPEPDDDNGGDDNGGDDNGGDDNGGDDNGGDDNGGDDNGGDDNNRRNQPPVIKVPQDRTYSRGQDVALRIPVRDAEDDPVTVSVSGLPPLLSFEPEGFVSGTITAEPNPYTVIISAKDESNPEVRKSFVITVEGVPTALQVRIVHPGDWEFPAGTTLSGNTAISISLTSDGYMLSAEGLPRGLRLYQDSRTSRDWYIAGHIRDDVRGRHTVRLTATTSSGVVVARQTFDITITAGTGGNNGGGNNGGGNNGGGIGVPSPDGNCITVEWNEANSPAHYGNVSYPFRFKNNCNRKFFITWTLNEGLERVLTWIIHRGCRSGRDTRASAR